MIKSYFITAIRNFWRNEIFSTINVLGLSIGISASLVLFLLVYYEFSFDRFEKDGNRIFRVVMESAQDGQTNYSTAMPAPLGTAAASELSGLEKTVPLFQFQGDGTAKVSIARNNSAELTQFKNQPEIIFTSQQYFGLLSYRWLAGGSTTALTRPFSVVLTESRAKQYYPGLSAQDIIGKTIIYNDTLKTSVTGIVEDLQERTYFSTTEFISLPTVMLTELKDNFMMETWNDWMAYSQLFVKLSPGASPELAEANLTKLFRKHVDANGPFRSLAFRLQPLNDVHFNYGSVGHRTAHKPTLYGLLAIAAFLLLLGCINFINLTTAQASERAKEIGVRKTMGGSRKQLIFQFLSETLFVTIIATLLALLLTPFLLTVFSDFIPAGLQVDLLHQPLIIVFLLGLIVLVSFLSGFYPALLLSGLKPVAVLKNQVYSADRNNKAWLRKTLTVSQFVIAQFFVIATLMVSRQINYTLDKDMGFKKEAIITFNLPRDTSKTNRYVLMQKVQALPGVQMASLGFLPPATDGPSFTNVKYSNGKTDIKADVQIRWGDTNYIKLYQIKLVAGRNVKQSDTISEFLINQTYAHLMGFRNPDDAIGKQLKFSGRLVPVVGVMHDFHERSMHTPIDPVVFASFNDRSNTLHISLNAQRAGSQDWQTAIAGLKSAYKSIYPESDFNYSFLDEEIAKFYTSESNASRLLQWATGLAILISCLGLLGLVIYTTNVRKKEIGIRKVLGATVFQIVSILSRDFVLLVIIAFIIAAPIAWWAIANWLQEFAYRTNMSLWIFFFSGLAMMLFALFTLGLQTINAAMANPVKSLRTE